MSERFHRTASITADYRAGAALVGLLAFLVYLRTLAPTVMWYDMGELTTTSYVLGIAHNTGYPLYILLGKLFTFLPFGDAAYRVNLMSAVFAARRYPSSLSSFMTLPRAVSPRCSGP